MRRNLQSEIEDTVNIWNKHIIPKKENLGNLISNLPFIEDIKTKIETLFKISKEFKILSALSQSKLNMTQSLCKLYNENVNKLILDLLEEYNDFQWKTILYQEKARRMIKDMNLVPPNYVFFNDIYIEYYWFIEKNMAVLEESELFDQWTPTPSPGLNIILNNLIYTQSGIKLILNHSEETNNLENLYLYYEVMGDLYFLMFLLIKKIYNETAGITYLYFATKSYEKSIQNKNLTERKEIHREGIVGFDYQDILYRLFEEEGIKGAIYNVNSKLSFISQKYKYDIRDLSIIFEDEPVDFKKPVLKKINDHLKVIGLFDNNNLDSHDRAWKLILEKLGFCLLHAFHDTHFYRKWAEKWEVEKQMDLWFAERFYQLVTENKLSYTRESMVGGGKCEHIINRIPIEDKIVDMSDGIKITDFLEKKYREYYPQTRQYALGESKYAVILITDRRPEIKRGIISPSAPENCILFRHNKEDNIWCAIFVFQVFTKTPSQLKTL
ncbi:MAG: hypothetical protein ACFFG0_33525 [Candidatus Thorarchaeota archaeon]